MKKSICLGIIAAGLLFLYGCGGMSLQSADGKSTLTDNNPLDSGAAISSGPGCAMPNWPTTGATPPTPAPVVVSAAKVCDMEGGNCQSMMIARPMVADPSTICNTTVAQTRGIGLAGFLGGLGGIAASIALLVGTGGI
jgi:hypothetical protein